MTNEHSLAWKMQRAYQLSANLCFVWDSRGHIGDVRDTTALFGEGNNNVLWQWSEGLAQQSYAKLMDGRCSLQQQMDFDPGKFEEEVDGVIALCLRLHARIGLKVPVEPIEKEEVVE